MAMEAGSSQKKKMPKRPPKQKAYEVTFKKSVPSEAEATSGGENGKVLQNSVLSGPEEEGMYNRFSCYAVNSKMAQSTNGKSKIVEMMSTEVPRILISHAVSYWLGLVRVLCDNKAPQIKRQVTSIDKKSDFRAKSGPFRTSTSHLPSSSQKTQTASNMVTSGKAPVPSPTVHSFEDAHNHGRKRHSRLKLGGRVDVSDEEQYIQDEPSVTARKELKTSKIAP